MFLFTRKKAREKKVVKYAQEIHSMGSRDPRPGVARSSKVVVEFPTDSNND
jgi:hypothetical protein